MDINNFIKVELIQDDEEKVELTKPDEEERVELAKPDELLGATGGSYHTSDVHDADATFCDPLHVFHKASTPLMTAPLDNIETRKIPPIVISMIKRAVIKPKLVEKISKIDKPPKEKKIKSTEPKKSIVACSSCGEEFVTTKSYSNHFLVNHSLETLCFNCPVCSKTFVEQRLLQNHRRSCTTEESFEKCPICEKVFTSKKLVKKHISTHSDERPHHCAECFKRFRTKADLKTHSVVHIPLEMRKIHNCDQCGRSFSLRRNFLTHLKMHNDPQIFICELCGNTFKTKGNLKSHQVHHTGEKKHSCPICDKSFASNSYLKTHILLHSNIKLYKCHICSKDFARRSILTKHLFVHNGIRPYPCKFCTKAFRAKDKLVVHERIHTGEKPYKCGFCPVAFCESGNLQKHKRNVHKDMILLGDKPVSTASYSSSGSTLSNPHISQKRSEFSQSHAEICSNLVEMDESLVKTSLYNSTVTDDLTKPADMQYNANINTNFADALTPRLFMPLQQHPY